ncbi:MAG: hypothetical protein WAK27_04095 [Candidatus Sulfotelmatobacter sp.]
MAIERTEFSGSPGGEEMAPLASTSATQNQAAPGRNESAESESGEKPPRRRESSAKKNSARAGSLPNENGMDGEGIEPVEQVGQVEKAGEAEPVLEQDGPPHRVDRLA